MRRSGLQFEQCQQLGRHRELVLLAEATLERVGDRKGSL